MKYSVIPAFVTLIVPSNIKFLKSPITIFFNISVPPLAGIFFIALNVKFCTISLLAPLDIAHLEKPYLSRAEEAIATGAIIAHFSNSDILSKYSLFAISSDIYETVCAPKPKELIANPPPAPAVAAEAIIAGADSTKPNQAPYQKSSLEACIYCSNGLVPIPDIPPLRSSKDSLYSFNFLSTNSQSPKSPSSNIIPAFPMILAEPIATCSIPVKNPLIVADSNVPFLDSILV